MTEEQNKLAERGVKMLTEEHLAKAICLYNGIALQGPDGSEQWWPFCSDAKRMLANADGQLERELAALRVEREPATEAVRDQVLEEAAKVCDEMPCDCCWHEDAQIMAETCAAAIRALKGKGASQGAGEFVRVPREPTAAQWKAGDEAWADGINAIYRAMIQAAASPDEQKG